MAHCDDLDFEDIVMAEERYQKEGYAVGLEEGKRLGEVEGTRLGQIHGAQLGSELGFYHGFVTAHRAFIDPTDEKNRRRAKVMDVMISLLDSFPKENPQDESIQESLSKIRAKFKQLSAMLNISTTQGNEQSLEKGISF